MRSDLPRFRKPKAPRIGTFVDSLEAKLRDEFERNPPRQRKAAKLLDRFGSLMLRPVLSGVMLVTLFAVVLLAVHPQRSIVMQDIATTQPGHETLSLWAEVVEVPDPIPQLVPFVVRVSTSPIEPFAFTHPTPIPDPPVGLSPF